MWSQGWELPAQRERKQPPAGNQIKGLVNPGETDVRADVCVGGWLKERTRRRIFKTWLEKGPMETMPGLRAYPVGPLLLLHNLLGCDYISGWMWGMPPAPARIAVPSPSSTVDHQKDRVESNSPWGGTCQSGNPALTMASASPSLESP